MTFDLASLGLKTFKKETTNERNGTGDDSAARDSNSGGNLPLPLDSQAQRVHESHEPGTEAGAGGPGKDSDDVERRGEARHESVSPGSVDSRAGNEGPVHAGGTSGAIPAFAKVPVVGFLGRLNTGSLIGRGPVIDGSSVDSGGDGRVESDPVVTKPSPGNFLQTLTAGKQVASPEKGISLLDAQPEETAEVIPPGPEGFQYRLDRLEALIQAAGQISPLTSDMVKRRIMTIFAELKEFPEYDGLIVDRDTHNIMAFMQHSITVAKGAFAAKVEKSTAKAKTSSRFKFDLDGPNSLETTMLHTPPSLKQFGTMIADDIAAKNRGEK